MSKIEYLYISGMRDSDFVHGLKQGDEVIFKKLLDEYQKPLIRLCKGFLHNEEDAKDIVQETFVEVFKSIHQFRSDARLSTWLYRIAVNKSLNLIRKNKINKWIVRLDVFSTKMNSINEYRPTEENPAQPGDKLEQNERYRQIKLAIDSLSDNQRIAFILSKHLDLSYKEISEVMEISLSSVESLIHRAKINLQKKLFTLYKNNLI